MSYRILEKKVLIPGQTTLLVIDAPHVAKHAKPGNFIILRTSDKGERIPLTIADCDPQAGTVTIVFLVVGKSTAELNTFEEGMSLPDFCGPLGKPTHIEKQGTVICVGGGTGVAAMHHIAKGHAAAGNQVVAVIGARNKDLLLFCSELGNFCPEVLVATDDGSQGHKGFVTEVLRQRLEEDKDVSEVVAIGPVPMMEAVAKVTRPFGVKTTVSLNSIMVDGPEFDGHEVDFGELRLRLSQFRPQEQESMQLFQEKCKCAEGK